MPTKKSRSPKSEEAEPQPSTPAIASAPMCIPLELDDEDVLLLSRISIAQWKAELGPEEFENRFTEVLDAAAPPSIDERSN